MQFKKPNNAMELDHAEPNNAMELDHAEPTAYYPLVKRFNEKLLLNEKETEEPMIYNN